MHEEACILLNSGSRLCEVMDEEDDLPGPTPVEESFITGDVDKTEHNKCTCYACKYDGGPVAKALGKEETIFEALKRRQDVT